VAIADLQALADGRAGGVVSTSFGVDEGLSEAAPISVCQPAVWRAADGRLWFTTYRGIVGLEPAAATVVRPAPPVFSIRCLSTDNRSRPIRSCAFHPGTIRL